jgi:tetratricopeptide (TPR) repeat protein
MNIAMLYQELDNIPKAIECLHKSLKCNEIIYGRQSLHISGCLRALAIAYSKIENFKEALNYEKQNYNILKELFGEGDIRTVESNIYLKQFTANAVKKARIEKVKEEESFCYCFFLDHSIIAISELEMLTV